MALRTYLSLGAFYGADRRRDASRERDYGLWWRGDGPHDPTYRAAWIEETGELYVMQYEGTPGGGRVDVLARFRDRLDCQVTTSHHQGIRFFDDFRHVVDRGFRFELHD